MAENLQWIFKLTDEMSAPLKKISESLGAVEKTISSPTQKLSALATGLNQASELIGGVLLKGFDVLAGIVGMGVGLGAVGAKFAYEATVFRENTLLGFETLLKSSEIAKNVFSNAVAFAGITPFQTKEVMEITSRLMAMGFRTDELQRVMTALGDLASGMGGGSELAKQLATVMGQIRAKGKLMGDEVLQLTQAGLSQSKLYENLAKLLGKKPKEIQKLQEAGKISGDVALVAIAQTIEQNFGGLMAKASQSIGTLASTVASRPFEMIAEAYRVSEKGGGGLTALKTEVGRFLEETSKMLDPQSSRLGVRMVNTINDMGSAMKGIIPDNETWYGILVYIEQAFHEIVPDVRLLADDIGRIIKELAPAGDGPNAMAAGFRLVLDIVRGIVRFTGGLLGGIAAGIGPLESLGKGTDLESTMKVVEKLGLAIGFALGWIVRLVIDVVSKFTALVNIITMVWEYVSGIVEPFKALGQMLVMWFTELGGMIIEGLVNGLKAAEGKLIDAANAIFGNLKGVAYDGLQLGSPSKLFRQYGVWTMQGYIEGVQVPDVGAALQASITPALDEFAGITATTHNYGGVNVSAPLYMSGGDSETAQAAQAAVSRLLPTALASAIEQMAVEMGVA